MGEPISSSSSLLYRHGRINAQGAHVSSSVNNVPTASSLVLPTAESTTTAASTSSSSSSCHCPLLSNESVDVQQFLTSHAVNSGVVNLLMAYLTELSLRSHLTW